MRRMPYAACDGLLVARSGGALDAIAKRCEPVIVQSSVVKAPVMTRPHAPCHANRTRVYFGNFLLISQSAHHWLESYDATFQPPLADTRQSVPGCHRQELRHQQPCGRVHPASSILD